MLDSNKLFIACLMASVSYTASAEKSADEGLYIGVGVSQLDWQQVGEASFTALEGRIGFQYNPYFATELQLGGSLSDAKSQRDAWKFSSNLKHYRSLYLKPQFPMGERFSIYGLVGFTHIAIDVTAVDNNVVQHHNASGSGVSYGVGFHIHLVPQLGLDASWKRLTGLETRGQGLQEDELEGFNVSLALKF